MQKKSILSLLAPVALALATLSGCAQLSAGKTAVKTYMQLTEKEIAAPAGNIQLFDVSSDNMDKALISGTNEAVKSLLAGLEEPLSLTAPIIVSTLTSLNPEIISTNRFGSVTAGQISAALTAEGYTVNKKSTSNAALKARTALTGTYARSGKTLTIVLQLTDMSTNAVVSEREYIVPVDGHLRKLLDS